MRYDCQMDRGYCIDLYYTPGQPNAAGEVEYESPEGGPTTAAPRAPPPPPPRGRPGRPGAKRPGAKPAAGKAAAAPPPPPPPPRRVMRPNPMAHVRSECVTFDYDYFSCPNTGGICCYQV